MIREILKLLLGQGVLQVFLIGIQIQIKFFYLLIIESRRWVSKENCIRIQEIKKKIRALKFLSAIYIREATKKFCF